MQLHKAATAARAVAKLAYANATGRSLPIWAWNYITNRCNLNCTYCFVSPYWDGKSDLTYPELCKIFDEEKKMGVEIVTLLGGEPMMRADFGEIVEYLSRKRFIIDVITNGFFVQRHEKSLSKIDSMCISLDGNEETTDSLRGKGTYAKAIEAIRFVKTRGVSVRIHGVITKHSVNALPEMAKICRELGVTATYAMPSIHQNQEELRACDDEIRLFWKTYLGMKRAGAPFLQTDAAIEAVIAWPYPYFKILTTDDSMISPKVKRCRMKDRLILLGATGELYPCTLKYNQKGLNAKDVGVKEAFNYIRRTDTCVACSDLSCINCTLVSTLEPRVLLEIMRVFLRTYVFTKR